MFKVEREIWEKREKERKREMDTRERRKRREQVSDNIVLSVDANIYDFFFTGK